MKTTAIICNGLIAYCGLIALIPLWTARAAASVIVINEVLANPLDEDTGEFVELYNCGLGPVDVAGWRLSDTADTNDLIQDYGGQHDWGRSGTAIPAGGYALVVDPEYAGEYTPFLRAHADSADVILLTIGKDTTIGNGLTNAGDFVFLSDGENFVSSFGWSSDPGQAVSWEKIESSQGDDNLNWVPCEHPHGSTPGVRNSVSRALFDVEIPLAEVRITPSGPWPGQQVQISAAVHNRGKIAAAGVEVHFFHDQDADTLMDQGERIGSAQSVGDTLHPGQAVEISQCWHPPASGRQLVVVRALYPQDEDLSDNLAIVNVQVRYTPCDMVLNEIMHDPAPAEQESEKEPEWLEIFHLSSQPIDLMGWTIEDSRAQPRELSDSSVSLLPGDYAVVAQGDRGRFLEAYDPVDCHVLFPAAGLPALNNTEDRIVLRDPAGTPVDSVDYSSGWGGGSGISMERINPFLGSNDSLNWGWSVHPSGSTPGRQNSIYTPVVPSRASLSAAPNPFSPDGDGRQEVTVISYRLPSAAARMSLRLFDVRGRAVRVLVDQERCASRGDVIWDGRSDGGETLPMGIYILYMEAIDERRDLVCREKGTVVLAGRLE
jgi:hypothetical protein